MITSIHQHKTATMSVNWQDDNTSAWVLYLCDKNTEHTAECPSVKSTFSAQQFPRWQCESVFIRLAVVASQKWQAAQTSEKIWTYSSSRSSKMDDFGTNQKCTCDFLLIINSNFSPILHHFWDTASYWLKIAHFSYPSLIRRPRSLSSLWNFAVKLSVKKLDSWGYSVVKVAWS